MLTISHRDNFADLQIVDKVVTDLEGAVTWLEKKPSALTMDTFLDEFLTYNLFFIIFIFLPSIVFLH
jgi:hypothetical protein